MSLALFLPALLASGFQLPPGFNLETLGQDPGPVAGRLPDGSLLFSTGVFGADELTRRDPGGTETVFAAGFGSLGGLAVSPLGGEIVIGDSLGTGSLWILSDLNADGDALDRGEMTPHPVALPVLSNGAAPLPFELAFAPGSDELYVTGSTPFGVEPVLGVVVRIADGAAGIWADGLGFAGGMAFDGEDLLVADLDATFFVGRVLRLHDDSADGDALDPGEAVDFASGLSGASDLARASDGSVLLSGTFDSADFSATVARLLPDTSGDGVSEGVDETYLDGFGFSAGLLLIEDDGPFVPGSAGGGRLHVTDFPSFDPVGRLVRSAPRAEVALDGVVANDSSFTVTVSGETGDLAGFVMALDTAPTTVFGVADLCFGFGAPWVLLGPQPLGASGEVPTEIVLHGVGEAVGLPFVLQGFTIHGSSVGLSAGLDLVIAP